MRIAIDIDSTLHHYWDQLERVVERLYGVAVPYQDQRTWEIGRLDPDQVRAVVAETHADELILAAEPYPGAVETVREWHARGHYIHVTSHRADGTQAATLRWLERIGLPHDELYCSFDKLARCREIGIDLLIDDAPSTLERALEAGIAAATIEHPWNAELCARRDVVCAPDWPTLGARLEPLLGRDGGG